jgi:trimethylamine--corrinoid protein Co-methyltransferase
VTANTPRTERRAARRQKRAETPLLKLPFHPLRNPWPPIEVLGPEAMDRLHTASMRILEDMGLDFLDEETLELWARAGAKVDRARQHAWLDGGLVLELVAQAPRSFTWRARNPARSRFIGENAISFVPQGGVAYVTNLDDGRRTGTMADYENFLKLNQMINVLHFAGEQLIAPTDVPASLRHLKRLPLAFTLTDKAVMEAAHGREIAADGADIAGRSGHEDRPVMVRFHRHVSHLVTHGVCAARGQARRDA